MLRGFWDWGLQVISLLPCRASFRSATLLRWSSSDRIYSSSSWKSSSIVFGFFCVRCEAVGPGVRPLISVLIVVLSSASRIWDLCYMNLLTKFRNGFLYFCLQSYSSDDSAVVSWNIWNAYMSFVLRLTQLQTECGCSKEYQFRIGPSQAMMKDLASATSSPPAEFTAIHISWEIVWSFWSHCTSGEKLVWTSVATVQFAAL
jgi:hypothetical protein